MTTETTPGNIGGDHSNEESITILKMTGNQVRKKFVHEVSLELNSLFGRAEIIRGLRPMRADALDFIANAAREALQNVR